MDLIPEEVIDLGERALVRMRFPVRQDDGIEVERMAFHLWTFRDGMP